VSVRSAISESTRTATAAPPGIDAAAKMRCSDVRPDRVGSMPPARPRTANKAAYRAAFMKCVSSLLQGGAPAQVGRRNSIDTRRTAPATLVTPALAAPEMAQRDILRRAVRHRAASLDHSPARPAFCDRDQRGAAMSPTIDPDDAKWIFFVARNCPSPGRRSELGKPSPRPGFGRPDRQRTVPRGPRRHSENRRSELPFRRAVEAPGTF